MHGTGKAQPVLQRLCLHLGRLAQLVERLSYKQGVGGSNPPATTDS